MSTHKSNKYHSFGLALQEILDYSGKTPAWLARKTGKDKGQISKYINDKILPKRVTQIELTKPTDYEINNVDGEWLIRHKFTNEANASEFYIDYSIINLSEESKVLESIFDEIKSLNVLFDEILANESLSEGERKFRLKVIKSELMSLIKHIPTKSKPY